MKAPHNAVIPVAQVILLRSLGDVIYQLQGAPVSFGFVWFRWLLTDLFAFRFVSNPYISVSFRFVLLALKGKVRGLLPFYEREGKDCFLPNKGR